MCSRPVLLEPVDRQRVAQTPVPRKDVVVIREDHQRILALQLGASAIFSEWSGETSLSSPPWMELGAQTLRNFVIQIKGLPRWSLAAATKSHLIAAASAIRGRLTGPAPAEIVDTRHSH